jgi:PIN domain nuclease of toxin-antitoxin system
LKLLLDTHIWIWMMDDSKRLTSRIQQHLQDQTNELWLSPISTWEVLVLQAKGKIRLRLPSEVWVRDAIRDFKEAPLTHEIALVSRQLALHSDPADRFIAATAKVLDLTLVTSDASLLACPGVMTLSNRP